MEALSQSFSKASAAGVVRLGTSSICMDLLAAGGIVGTVQLVLSQPDNQPHRTDLAKMLAHRRVRRQGLGEALMLAAEATARECGKSLLVQDTISGDAERLYVRAGWQRVGVIPGYALWPQGGLCDTSCFYRHLTV